MGGLGSAKPRAGEFCALRSRFHIRRTSRHEPCQSQEPARVLEYAFREKSVFSTISFGAASWKKRSVWRRWAWDLYTDRFTLWARMTLRPSGNLPLAAL